MSFLTQANSQKIIRSIDFEEAGNIKGTVYKKPIYFFSKYEKNELLGLKELFKNPNQFIEEYYVPVEKKDTKKYIYEGRKPAYHSNPDCEKLKADYKNFEIPEEIREKGEEKISEFRKWFKNNQYLLDEPEKFVAKLQLAFGIRRSPKAIRYDNSGVEIKENLNLEELENRINQYISDAGQYYNKSNSEKKYILRRFQKYTFLAYTANEIYNNDTRFSDDAIKKFLNQYDIHFKRPIKELLIEYYRIMHNPELKFEGDLLEELGFKPCSFCHGEVLARF